MLHKDLIGCRFGRLIVLEKTNKIKTTSSERKNIKWLCRCDCGLFKEVYGSNLRDGKTKSCGCLWKSCSVSSIRNRVLCGYKEGAKSRGYSWGLSEQEFDLLTNQNCYYCGVEPNSIRINNGNGATKLSFIYNGIDRLDNTKGYEVDNCVSCCRICNKAKDVLTPKDFISWANRVSEYCKNNVKLD